MRKLFLKDEIWFAVAWIGVYVLAFGNADTLSEAMGCPKLLTCVAGLILTAVLWGFIRKNGLTEYFGLCRVKGDPGKLLYFVPLVIISSVNLWCGVTWNMPLIETVLYIISMCFVGFLEEVIFRGLLFKGMCKGSVRWAVIISSLTFGVGHAVNLLLGAPVFETLLQLVYASAVGFCYTAVFLAGGSILPCILSHGIVNSLSAFALTPSAEGQAIIAAVQTALSVGYGIWLLTRRDKKIGI